MFQSLDNVNLGPRQLKLILENTDTAVALCHIKQTTIFDTKDKCVKEPVNKKTTKELSFFSTKNKKSFKKTPLPKASREDSKVLDEIINNKPYQFLIKKNPHAKIKVLFEYFEKHAINNCEIPNNPNLIGICIYSRLFTP